MGLLNFLHPSAFGMTESAIVHLSYLNKQKDTVSIIINIRQELQKNNSIDRISDHRNKL